MGGRRAHRAVAAALASVAVAVGAAIVVPAAVAAPPPVRIYPLGDSITLGYSVPSNVPGGYRTILDSILGHDGVAHQFVGSSASNPSPSLTAGNQAHHDGHNGYRIDQDATALDGTTGLADDHGGSWLTGTATRAPITPDVVLVHLGTNDIYKRYDPTTSFADGDPFDDPAERDVFVADMTARLSDLIDKLLALRPNARIVVATVIPLAMGKDIDTAPPVAAEAVRRLVADDAAAGKPVYLADAYAAFTSGGSPLPGLLSSDGAHPTAAGYTRLAQVFATATEAALAA